VSTRQELEQAIIALEAKRNLLGNEVVDISLSVLRQKLNSLQSGPVVEYHDKITVLVADLTNYTAMSESMDAEEVGDTINALWEKLDGVIKNWGGKIDKHIGDGLIALFGLPTSQKDDLERAILAALDIQLELDILNQRAVKNNNNSSPETLLRMRIGIDCGPVFFGQVGTSNQQTTVGEAVNMAIQLQQLAPIGGILISYDAYSLVHSFFDVEVMEPVAISGKTSRIGVYIVQRDKPSAFQPSFLTTRDMDSRMVGRQTQLDKLELALQWTMDQGTAQFYTIFGEQGVGKSRLLREFEQVLNLLPMHTSQFKGIAQYETSHYPYAMIRNLLANYFSIHLRSSPEVAREKLVKGIVSVFGEENDKSEEWAHFIGHLLGFDFSYSPYLLDIVHDTAQIRERAFDYLIDFFTIITLISPATILLLDNVQWADERSLDFIEHLFNECQDIPLLIVCSGRSSLFEKRPSWPEFKYMSTLAYNQMELVPLSSINSRHLISEIFHGTTQLPLKATDLLVEKTGGNPFQILELTNALIDNKVLIKESNQWRLQMGKLHGGQLLPSLTDLLQRQLDHLPSHELEILQLAAVLGSRFSKPAVYYLAKATDDPKIKGTIDSILKSLIEKQLLCLEAGINLHGEKEYVFWYQQMRDIAYESVPSLEKLSYHLRAAAYFIIQNTLSLLDYAYIIASHFERGGNLKQAAEWYGRAAIHAQHSHAPMTAIQAYLQALSFLPDEAEFDHQRIIFNEGLGELFHKQGRYAEAIETYHCMQTAAQAAGDIDAQVRAILGLFLSQDFQGQFPEALQSSEQAELIARVGEQSNHLAMSMAAKAWSLMRLHETDKALALAIEALSLSRSTAFQRDSAFCNALIGNICWLQKWFDKAIQATEKALVDFHKTGDRLWEALMLRNLGSIACDQGDYLKATSFFEDSLKIARNSYDYHGMLQCFRHLGNIAHYQGDNQGAIYYSERAYIISIKINNCRQQVVFANQLGGLHLAQVVTPWIAITQVEKDNHKEQAYSWINHALNLAEKSNDYDLIASARVSLARLLVEENRLDEAVDQAKKALSTIEKVLNHPIRVNNTQITVAMIWHTFGLIASQLSPQELPMYVGTQAYDVTDCFNESLHVLKQIGQGVELEKLKTLLAWAKFEFQEGNEKRAESLLQQAQDIFVEIGMDQEVARTNISSG